ncbi:MAG TPA: DegV family protein [Dehalococcoidales bacterium]|nr:DegV family protein [Dehalococcoidales bacterium]
MAVKIVTDSSADLPAELIKELGISVVPLYVRFGDEVYRERVSITDDEFYQKLVHGPVHPVTIQPGPQDFVEVYKKLVQEADGIVSIHLSSKLSGTYNSALQAKEMVGEGGCPIEVVDSGSITMAMGLVCIAAAEAAKAGKDLEQVLNGVKQDVPNAHLLALFDTLKYLQLGGRIGKAKALLGSILNVKPMITLKDGEVMPAGQVRTRAKGIERLVDFVKNAQDIESLAVGYSTTLDEAQTLAKRLASIFTKEPVKIARLGTTLGVHAGPGTLVVTLRGKIAE